MGIGHSVVHRVLESILGTDYLTYELSSDTPLRGSVLQFVHGDGPRSADGQIPIRTFPMVSVNFPLVDVNDTNGAFHIIPRSQHLPRSVVAKLVWNGTLEMVAVHLRRGDVMIRNLETLHRGTPNWSDDPRPIGVWGFASSTRQVPQHVLDQQLRLPDNQSAVLTDVQKKILRLWL